MEGALDDTDAQANSLWPELEVIAKPARERRRLTPETRSQIIIAMCTRAPLSVKELGQLLDRSEAYIGDAIRPLVTAGELTFLYPDQPRHPKQKYISRKPAPAPVVVSLSPPIPSPAPVAPSTPVLAAAPASVGQQAPNPDPARTEATAGADAESTGTRRRRRRVVPNQWTNVLTVIAAGIALQRWSVTGWPLIAFAVGLALGWAHMFTNSGQYEQYRTLHSTSRARRRATFIVLKASVALVEIAIVYFAAHAYNRMR